MNRIIRRRLFDIPISSASLPPTFLLPSRARYFNSTTQIIDHNDGFNGAAAALSQSTNTIKQSLPSLPRVPTKPEISTPVDLSESTRQLLPLLASQPGHFISAHIHDHPYLVTAGDTIRLPYQMPGVVPGDILRLNRASVLGSRDFTLKAASEEKYLDERLFECRATVLGVEADPMRYIEKTKRRNRKIKVKKNKQKHTVLRVSELRVKGLEEIEAEIMNA